MGSSATLKDIRQFVAREMGGMGQGGFLSSTATSGTVSTLVDATWPAMTSLSVDEQWQDAWVFRPNAALASDKVRLVSTYTPSTGTFTVDTNYTNVPTASEAYEIHTVIEPLTHMNIIINEGLKRCMLQTNLALTPTPNQDEHLLTTLAPWLFKKSWVRSVGWLSQGVDRFQFNPYNHLIRGEAYEWDGGVRISHPGRTFLATDTLFIKAMKPAYNDCRNASVSYGSASAIAVNTTTGTWTVTVSSTSGMTAGDVVTLSGFVPTIYNDVVYVASVPNGTTFTINNLNTSPGTITTLGTVSGFTFQNGLNLESDIVPADFEWVGWAAIVEGWRANGKILETGARARMLPDRQEAAAMYSDKNKDNVGDNGRWPILTFRPLLCGGPRVYSLHPAYRATTA